MLAYKIKPGTPEERAAAVRMFRDAAALSRQAALLGAKAVLELERTGAHHAEGASSIAHFGELNGVSASEARTWVNLGIAISRLVLPLDRADSEGPDTGGPGFGGAGFGGAGSGDLGGETTERATIESEVAAGTIPVASAAVLGEVVAVELSLCPELNLPGMDGSLPAVPVDGAWFTLARARSTREFQRVFLRRREEARVGGPVTKFVAYVTLAVHDDLTRARTLASRKATHALSMGQTLGVVVGDWLAANDPMRKTPGTRRVPDTTTVPTSRYVPAEVDRHVRLRTDDRCAVPFCDATMWLHRSHRIAHRDGGNREAEQLDLLCPYHHFLYESGRIRINGPADAPVVTDAHGRPSTERRPWPDRAPSQRPRQPSTTPGGSPRSSVSRSAPGFVAHQRDAPASTPGDAATAGGDAASGAPPRETRTGPEPPVPSDG